MSSRFPDRIDPFRCCDQAKEFAGRVPLARLERLADSLLSTEGEAVGRFRFGRDEQGLRVLLGEVHAPVTLECQACLHPVEIELEAEVALALVRSDLEAQRLPDHYDPQLVDKDELDLQAVLEDELMLALPLLARHEEGGCGEVQSSEAGPASDESESTEKRDNPFAVLAQLKSK